MSTPKSPSKLRAHHHIIPHHHGNVVSYLFLDHVLSIVLDHHLLDLVLVIRSLGLFYLRLPCYLNPQPQT
jgi:hypothetical protein